MPRDPSGNHTLPAGNPVVTQTIITSVWANTTMSDLSAALTDSLSRSGKGAMQAALGILDDVASSPGLYFINEPTSGFRRQAAGDVRLRSLGTDYFRVLDSAKRAEAWSDAGNGFYPILSQQMLVAKQFGAKGDGVTNDSAAIQAALDAAGAAGARAVYFEGGTYLCSGLKIPPSVSLIGDGWRATFLKMPDSTNTYIAASASYVDNLTTVDRGGTVRGLTFDGNKANNTSGHGLILRNFDCRVYDCYFQDAPEHNIFLTAQSANGTDLTGGQNVHDIFIGPMNYIKDAGSAGVYGQDLAVGSGGIADIWVNRNIFRNNGSRTIGQVHLERGAGCYVEENWFSQAGSFDIFVQSMAFGSISHNKVSVNARLVQSGDTVSGIFCEGAGSQANSTSIIAFIGNQVTIPDATTPGVTYSLVDFSNRSIHGLAVIGNVLYSQVATLDAMVNSSSQTRSIMAYGNAVSDGNSASPLLLSPGSFLDRYQIREYGVQWNPGTINGDSGVTSPEITLIDGEPDDGLILLPPYGLQGVTATAYTKDTPNTAEIRLYNSRGSNVTLGDAFWRVKLVKRGVYAQ